MPDMSGWIPGKSKPENPGQGTIPQARSIGIAGAVAKNGNWQKAASKEDCLALAHRINAQLPQTHSPNAVKIAPGFAANGVSYVTEGPFQGACMLEQCWNPLVAGPGESGIPDTEKFWEPRGTVAQFHVGGGWITCGPGCFGELPEGAAKFISENCDYSWLDHLWTWMLRRTTRRRCKIYLR